MPPPWNAGNDTNKRNDKMITTRSYHETIVARIKRDREFARLFYAGAVEMILEGETAGALSRLRDLVNAQISFKELARQTGLGEKSLHRISVATAMPPRTISPPFCGASPKICRSSHAVELAMA